MKKVMRVRVNTFFNVLLSNRKTIEDPILAKVLRVIGRFLDYFRAYFRALR